VTSAPNPVISIVTAAYNEALNLPVLYQQIVTALQATGKPWEWVVVDDHSTDGTFDVIRKIADGDARVSGFRLARNSGSHLAMTCGAIHARGQCAIILAADLQDPPETVGPLLEKWNSGAQVVWAVRDRTEQDSASTMLFARFYYWLLRRVAGLHNMPADGADFLLMDRRVMDALREFQPNTGIQALIAWMGFRQDQITYVKRARLHGSSTWSLGKKLKLVLSSLTAYGDVTIRLVSISGMCLTLAGLVYAAVLIFLCLAGTPASGWNAVLAAVLALAGFHIVLMGMLGECIWRGLSEASRRPRFLIEDETGAGTSRPMAPS
jgi:polyisoprenyl-phosphate glycosyltransferase